MSVRTRRRPTAFTESLSTSFLDVLSNGLGAGILLMVLIAAIPIERPAAPVPEGPFIRGSWTVVDDEGAILSLRLMPPNGSTFDVDLRQLDVPAAYGALTLDCRWPGVSPAGRVEIYGFSVAGAAAATSGDNASPKDRTFVLWVNEPMPGDWDVGVIYSNRSDSGRGRQGQIVVKSMLETSNGPIDAPLNPLPMVFGEFRSAGAFSIPDYGPDEVDDSRRDCDWL